MRSRISFALLFFNAMKCSICLRSRLSTFSGFIFGLPSFKVTTYNTPLLLSAISFHDVKMVPGETPVNDIRSEQWVPNPSAPTHELKKLPAPLHCASSHFALSHDAAAVGL